MLGHEPVHPDPQAMPDEQAVHVIELLQAVQAEFNVEQSMKIIQFKREKFYLCRFHYCSYKWWKGMKFDM